VAVRGRLRLREYERTGGGTATAVEVIASELEFLSSRSARSAPKDSVGQDSAPTEKPDDLADLPF